MGYVSLICLGLALCCAGLFWDLLAFHRLLRDRVTEEQRVEAVRNKKMMEALVATDGWKMLAAVADAQVAPRKNRVTLTPTTDVVEENFMKGEIQGIELFVNLPRKLIEESDAIIKMAMEQELD